MQIEFLETFVEVARYGSITRAAGELYVSQPSVSARLQALEAELGEQLLERTRRGVRLTDAGREFLPYAERAVRAFREGQTKLEEVREARSGHLALGAAPAVSTYYLPAVLKRFALEHPNVRLSVRTGHSEDVLQMVLEDQVQIGLVRSMQHPEIEVEPCYEDELILLVHPAHPFRTREAVTLEEVAREGLVMFDRTSSYFELTRVLFLDRGLVPATAMELDNIESAKKMVELGMGVALLPRVAVSREVAMGTLVPVAIRDAASIHRPVLAIYRRGAGLSGPGLAFLALVRELRAINGVAGVGASPEAPLAGGAAAS
ncbi:MAG: LysR family transcriptional regulator [Chloroflexi bacterium]|nr:LysR family transcriptional regulator [Chloroflexota bacterium]